MFQFKQAISKINPKFRLVRMAGIMPCETPVQALSRFDAPVRFHEPQSLQPAVLKCNEGL